MTRNIEIKARIASVSALAAKVAALADAGPVEIAQDDTFFRCANGRLKLRAFSPNEGELILYHRADRAGPKESHYRIVPTGSPDALRDVLSLACGTAGRVHKLRTLYRIGRTRIHLDRVDGLGDFVELEVVLAPDESTHTGVAEAHALMGRLGIEPGQLIEGAYVDLLAARGSM